MCSHNNVIYNFKYKLNEKQNFYKKYIKNKTRLYDIVVLLDKLKLSNENLIDSFESILNKNIIDNKTSDIVIERILKFINYSSINKKPKK